MTSRVSVSEMVSIVKQAGKAILRIYEHGEYTVKTKAGENIESPVTEADLTAHRLIVESLRQLSDRPIISEEGIVPPFCERRTWKSFWLLDPLDGTKEFINRNGEFTVNLALIQDRIPTMGVVHAPALDLTYFGSVAQGAFRQMGNHPPDKITVSGQDVFRPRVVTSRSHPSSLTSKFLLDLDPFEVVSVGSSLKFCKVAEGSANLYPRLGPTMEWDTAAGQCVVEAAGGQVILDEGTPLTYNKEDLRNPVFFAIASADAAFWKNKLTEH